jgi:hypothetical protein
VVGEERIGLERDRAEDHPLRDWSPSSGKRNALDRRANTGRGFGEQTDEDIPVGVLGAVVGEGVRRNCERPRQIESSEKSSKYDWLVRDERSAECLPRSRLISQMVTAPGGGKLGIAESVGRFTLGLEAWGSPRTRRRRKQSWSVAEGGGGGGSA